MTAVPAFSSTFIFEVGELDHDFHRINDEVAERARSIPGFLGEEAWHDPETGLHAEVYYWESYEALRQLVDMDTHRIAKVRSGSGWGRIGWSSPRCDRSTAILRSASRTRRRSSCRLVDLRRREQRPWGSRRRRRICETCPKFPAPPESTGLVPRARAAERCQ
ncbi:antibiotic biosynthesis monooxygenase family protein [Leucobacter soli]|uniref:antibiotic biosynthesis monooxygenase family protein n=1 Tax=Leucobacter soli TaxID=2812850 RepID=UPI0036210DBD